MRLSYAALSDVGRVRKDNQDSGYASSHLLVIADGVGGSARGDIASSATVEMLRKLDEPAPADEERPDDMLGALAGAIHRSHDRIAQLVREMPELEGTSSTVTAAMFDGTVFGIGHVGDSRGYLLRDGTLSQLTTDHTFVQSLVDEGRITEDEARVHPHRNLILRAVDGVHEPEPDVFTLDAAPGDRLLLCSDGCSGALSEEDLARVLGQGTPDEAATQLVDAALAAGSSDNVTVVVADVRDDADEGAAAAAPVVVGAAAATPKRRPAPSGAHRADTGELPPVREELDPEEARYAPRAPRRRPWIRRIALLAFVLGLLAVIAVGGYKWTQSQYYVANDGEDVVIFQGVQADVPGIRMHSVKEGSPYVLADLPEYRARQVRDGITASSLADARDVISSLRSDVTCPPSPTPTPTKPSASKPASPKPKPSPAQPKPTPSPSPSPSATPTHTPAVCLESPSPSPTP